MDEWGLRAALRADPANAPVLKNLASLLEGRGALAEAEEGYRTALQLDPGCARSWNNLGVLLKRRGAFREAESSYRAAIRAGAVSGRTHYNLGFLLRQRGAVEEAEASYQAAVGLDPGNTEAWTNLAALLLGRGAREEAEASCRRALSLRPERAEVWTNLALILEGRQVLAEAEAAHRRALRLCPGSAAPRSGLARLLGRRGKTAEAQRWYAKALRLEPGSVEALEGLGGLLRGAGRLEEAEAAYRRALGRGTRGRPDARGGLEPPRQRGLRADPRSAASWISLAGLQRESGRAAEGEASFRAAAAADPASALAHYSLGFVLKQRGALEEAEASYRAALRVQPGGAVGSRAPGRSRGPGGRSSAVAGDELGAAAWTDLGGILQMRGAPAEAEACYRAALKLDPLSPVAWSNLGHHLYDRSDLAAAEASFTSALRALDGGAGPQGEAGAARGSSWSWEKDAVEVRSVAHWLLGNVRLRRGDATGARQQWRSAIGVLEESGKSPVHAAMSLGSGGEAGYRRALLEEAEAFRAACGEAAERAATGAEGAAAVANLPAALQEVRRLENTTEWIMQWAEEMVAKASIADEGRSTYGGAWFGAWKAAVERPVVQAALQRAGQGGSALVVGSALGEQCYFALALGFSRCVGYDLLCKSLVTPARRIAEGHGLQRAARFRCADAREAGDFRDVALAWVNDEAFPEESRRGLLSLFARHLPQGAVAVVFREPSKLAPPWDKALPVVDTLQVEVSWDPEQRLYVMQKGGRSEAREDL